LGNEKVWLIGWDRSTTSIANEYASKHKEFLDASNHLVYVDTSQIPAGIYSLFVTSRMESFKHPIMQSFDEKYNKTLPYREGHVTILRLKNRKIISIKFAQNIQEVEKILVK